MSKNKYTQTFSAFNPSDEAVERIFEMTADKKKTRINAPFKRITAAALAFVMIIGGGFGVNSLVKRNDETSDKLGIMIVYAGEQELLEAGKANEQEIFYGLYVADINDKQAMSDAKNRWGKDKAKQMEIAEKLGAEHIRAGLKSGNDWAYSKTLGEDTAVIYTLSAGNFVLNLSDYTNVKDITIENSSRYGLIYAEYWNKNYDVSEFGELYNEVFGEDSAGFTDVKEYSYGKDTDKIVFTKAELLASAEIDDSQGYLLYWEISDYLKFTIGEDVNFDLSQIRDTIIFTVHYDDGTSEQASVSLSLDSDGYMHIDGAE